MACKSGDEASSKPHRSGDEASSKLQDNEAYRSGDEATLKAGENVAYRSGDEVTSMMVSLLTNRLTRSLEREEAVWLLIGLGMRPL